MRILLVEDEPHAAQVLAKGLREQAYAVDVAADGEAAIFQSGTTDYDGLILDVMLPLVDGLTVCRTIRESGCAVPILMLTARDAVESRVEGLDCGADDYLVKPYDFRELLARLRALIRRGHQPVCRRSARRRTAHHRDAKPPWSASTTGRFSCAPRNTRCSSISPGARAKSSAAATSPSTSGTNTTTRMSNVVDVYVQRLRRKLDEPGRESLIRTRRGEGYQLTPAIEEP